MKINKLTPGKNLRWESSRMMLPEHVQALHDHEVEEEKFAKPVLDDQEIEMIDRRLRQSLEQSQPLNIEYYDQGFIKKLTGAAVRYDRINRMLYVVDQNGIPRNLKIDTIVNLE